MSPRTMNDMSLWRDVQWTTGHQGMALVRNVHALVGWPNVFIYSVPTYKCSVTMLFYFDKL